MSSAGGAVGPKPSLGATAQPEAGVQKDIYKDKLGDKLTVFSIWTLGLPVVLLVLGGLFGVEAIKVQNLYVLNVGILLSGIGEALASGDGHHRKMHVSIGANLAAIIFLVLAWVMTAVDPAGSKFFEEWLCAVVATVITAMATVANIMIGVGRDVAKEVARWIG
ncbi:hypothetical protein [Micromonospora sp. WMMD712]|uniref:hypothetical protein n=1 Tax=Micromonospora sp. WMMD712 TaxID=3016096 RepID=UPI00249B9D2E|nr:hypothetical protein [Micromonospora sp. WMMD712]WFE59659.1 hypothetical protein O7633_23640 [Micromonospora sp. WMMD712]